QAVELRQHQGQQQHGPDEGQPGRNGTRLDRRDWLFIFHSILLSGRWCRWSTSAPPFVGPCLLVGEGPEIAAPVILVLLLGPTGGGGRVDLRPDLSLAGAGRASGLSQGASLGHESLVDAIL